MIVRADARRLPVRDGCVQTCITSPPYWGLRDYGTARWEGGDPDCSHQHGRFSRGGLSAKQASNVDSQGDETRGYCPMCGARRVDSQIGLEPTPDAYVATLVEVFREVRRVLRDDGTLWLNLGDSYASGGTVGRNDTTPQALLRRAARYGTGKGIGSLVGRHGSRPSVTSLKPKDLVGIPWRVAFALQADGWYLRQDIIWHKPNPMPESVTDRCTKAHEYVFVLAKSQRYYWDAAAIAEVAANPEGFKYRGGYREMRKHNEAAGMLKSSGDVACHTRTDSGSVPHFSAGYGANRNRRSVWTVTTEPYLGAHYAVMPTALVEPMVLAGAPMGGLVLDPFCGTGTVLEVAQRLGRVGVGCDLAYQHLSKERTAQRGLRWSESA